MMKSTRIMIIVSLFIALLAVFYSFAACADYDRLDTFNIIYFDSVPYISFVDLAETYGIKISYDPLMLTMTAQRGGTKLTLANLSRIAVLNGSPQNIILPVRLLRGSMFAPIPTFLPLFSELIPATLTWDEKKRAVRTSGITNTIKKVTFERFSNGELIRIGLTEHLKHTVELNQNNWLTVSIIDGSFDPDTLFTADYSPLIRDKRCFQYDGEAQVSFLISDEVSDYSVSPSTAPDEILISLYKKRHTFPAALSQPLFEIQPAVPKVEDKLWRIDTVIIDPGHGGKDSGAVGPNGTKEKDVVLNVARELKKIIDKRGEIKAVLTRKSDIFIPLYQRARIANDNNGKLFISIHANGSPKKNVQGIEVYFLSAAKEEDAKAVAQRENASIKFEENLEHYGILFNNSSLPKDMEDILNDMVSNVFLKESQDMCNVLLDTTCSVTRQKKRGVKQAGFYVMLGTQATMPSILFEMGYISNPQEEKMLKRASYQKRLAQAIYDSIITFKKRHERGLFSRSE